MKAVVCKAREQPRYTKKKLPAQLSDISQYYDAIEQKQGHVLKRDIRLEDIEHILGLYASDLKCNIYTIMEVFHLRRVRVYELLHSEGIDQKYQAAREERASLALSRGLEVLEETYERAIAGDSNRDAVNAARYLSSYNMAYAQMISDEFRDKEVGNVTIHVNVPSFNTLQVTEARDNKDNIILSGEVRDGDAQPTD